MSKNRNLQGSLKVIGAHYIIQYYVFERNSLFNIIEHFESRLSTEAMKTMIALKYIENYRIQVMCTPIKITPMIIFQVPTILSISQLEMWAQLIMFSTDHVPLPKAYN